MTKTRFIVLLIAMSLIAAACGTDGGSDPDDAGGTDDVSAGEDTGATGESGDAEEAADPTAGLISPTQTDEPLNLDGGVERSDEGVTVVSDDPQGDLRGDVRDITSPWPTDWSRRTIELGTLGAGIPATDPRDRIPPIDLPLFESIQDATWLDDREPGALVEVDGDVRFYSLSILTRHEIVNDRFGDVPVAVTYCPLCNTAIAFDARVDGQALRFGVSGLLRNSDVVMWDEGTTSLWQQITGEAVVGEFAGTQLDFLPTAIVSYGDARENFPDALSLSRETGFDIAYGANPYTSYSSSASPFLFNGEVDDRYPALSRVVGVDVDGTIKGYPFQTLFDERAVNDTVNGVDVAVFWGGDTADALDSNIIANSQTIGTGIAFNRQVGDEVLTFTNNGDDTFTDAETGTTWSLLGVGLDGQLAGERLEPVAHRNEFWFAWAAFFPEADTYPT